WFDTRSLIGSAGVAWFRPMIPTAAPQKWLGQLLAQSLRAVQSCLAWFGCSPILCAVAGFRPGIVKPLNGFLPPRPANLRLAGATLEPIAQEFHREKGEKQDLGRRHTAAPQPGAGKSRAY